MATRILITLALTGSLAAQGTWAPDPDETMAFCERADGIPLAEDCDCFVLTKFEDVSCVVEYVCEQPPYGHPSWSCFVDITQKIRVCDCSNVRTDVKASAGIEDAWVTLPRVFCGPATDECLTTSRTQTILIPVEQCWRLAKRWYADRMDREWARGGAAEAEAAFEAVGLTGEFWRLR